jgi:outer membrane biosynthesis protein TonB
VLLNVDEKGNVTDVKMQSAQPPRVFDREVVHVNAVLFRTAKVRR